MITTTTMVDEWQRISHRVCECTNRAELVSDVLGHRQEFDHVPKHSIELPTLHDKRSNKHSSQSRSTYGFEERSVARRCHAVAIVRVFDRWIVVECDEATEPSEQCSIAEVDTTPDETPTTETDENLSEDRNQELSVSNYQRERRTPIESKQTKRWVTTYDLEVVIRDRYEKVFIRFSS